MEAVAKFHVYLARIVIVKTSKRQTVVHKKRGGLATLSAVTDRLYFLKKALPSAKIKRGVRGQVVPGYRAFGSPFVNPSRNTHLSMQMFARVDLH